MRPSVALTILTALIALLTTVGPHKGMRAGLPYLSAPTCYLSAPAAPTGLSISAPAGTAIVGSSVHLAVTVDPATPTPFSVYVCAAYTTASGLAELLPVAVLSNTNNLWAGDWSVQALPPQTDATLYFFSIASSNAEPQLIASRPLIISQTVLASTLTVTGPHQYTSAQGELYVGGDSELALVLNDPTLANSSAITLYLQLDNQNPLVYQAPLRLDTMAGISDGPHTLNYWAASADGALESTHQLALIVDNTPPLLSHTLDGPFSADGIALGPITLAIQASDTGSGLRCISVLVASTALPVVANGQCLYPYQSGNPLVIDSTQVVNFAAIDNVGNTSYGESFSVAMATATPLPDLNSSAPSATPSDTAAGTATPSDTPPVIYPTQAIISLHKPSPTRTPHPTRTPRPTHILRPTRTPRPTHTPRPTRTPSVTHTPRPTRTPSVTHTPHPTRTPVPSHTPRPTHTPTPTHTPRPTKTSTPADSGSSARPQPTTTTPTQRAQKSRRGSQHGATALPEHAHTGKSTDPGTLSPAHPLVVAIQRGERSAQVQAGAGHDEILIISGPGVKHLLASGLTLNCCGIGGLTASPDGRSIAFSQEANESFNQPDDTEGLWLMTTSGTGLHRLIKAPTLPYLGNGIGPLAWSPDQPTLAYGVNSIDQPPLSSAAGIWLTNYRVPRPRLKITLAQLRAALPPLAGPYQRYGVYLTNLSWAPDGRTLAVSVQYPTATQSNFSTAVIAVNSMTGQAQLLVADAGLLDEQAVYAPTQADLAFVTVAGNKAILKVATEPGRPALTLATISGQISSPVWSPDGSTIAYLATAANQESTTLYTVNVATGRSQQLISSTQLALHDTEHLVRLAWL